MKSLKKISGLIILKFSLKLVLVVNAEERRKRLGNDKLTTLLLVEDEMMIAMEKQLALSKFGYEVMLAASGEEAVRIFNQYPSIDLVLMDIHLGDGMDGLETASKILGLRPIPILFLSNHSESEIIKKAEKIPSYGYILKNTAASVLDINIKMALKLFAANNANNVNYLNLLTQNLKEVLWVRDFATRKILFVNEAYEKVWGRSCQSFYQNPESSIDPIYAEDRPKVLNAIRKQYEKKIFNEDYRIIMPNGELKWIHANAYPVLDPLGENIKFFVGIAEDITERKLAEEKIRESELRYRIVSENIYDWEYWIDKKNRIVFISPSCYRITGYKDTEFLEDNELLSKIVHHEDLEKLTAHLDQVAGEKKGQGCQLGEFRIIHKNGEVRWINHICQQVYDNEGKVLGRRVCNQDITHRRAAEDKIKWLLEEKEILLKEVHHRIKNNMSHIILMLSLQSGQLKEGVEKDALESAINRVRGMQVLYDKLFQTPDFKNMSVLKYLPALVDEMLKNFPHQDKIQLETRIEDFTLDAGRLQPVGIIVNELVTNVLKYAFMGREEGRLFIGASLKEKAQGLGSQVTITVEDNGIGLPNPTSNNTESFGLVLVERLTKQLKGQLKIEKGTGTKIVVEFDL